MAPATGGGRTLGNPFAPHRGTAVVDIQFKRQTTSQISIYMCDYNGASGSVLGQQLAQAIQVFDVRSLTNSSAREQVMPIQRVDHIDGGVWLSIKVSGSVRIRFSQIRGDEPTLSGVFFDNTY